MSTSPQPRRGFWREQTWEFWRFVERSDGFGCAFSLAYIGLPLAGMILWAVAYTVLRLAGKW